MSSANIHEIGRLICEPARKGKISEHSQFPTPTKSCSFLKVALTILLFYFGLLISTTGYKLLENSASDNLGKVVKR